MKIFKKYVLLLIIATCALHTGAFGMQNETKNLSEKLIKNLKDGNFEVATETIKQAREKLDKKHFKLFITTTPDSEYRPNVLFEVFFELDRLYDCFPDRHRSKYCKCLGVAKEIINAALVCLDGEDLYLFADARNLPGESILFYIVEFLCNPLDDICLLEVAQSLIEAAGYAIKQQALGLVEGSEKFSQFILAVQNGKNVFEKAKFSYWTGRTQDNYYGKVAKLFIGAIKCAENKDCFLSARVASELIRQIFLADQFSEYTSLMLIVKRYQRTGDVGPVKNFLRLAEILPRSDFKDLIEAEDMNGLSVFEWVKGNPVLCELLDNAIENNKVKQDLFDKKRSIKSDKKKIEQLVNNVQDQQEKVSCISYMLKNLKTNVNTVIE